VNEIDENVSFLGGVVCFILTPSLAKSSVNEHCHKVPRFVSILASSSNRGQNNNNERRRFDHQRFDRERFNFTPYVEVLPIAQQKRLHVLPLLQQSNPLSIGILFAALSWRLFVVRDLINQQSTVFLSGLTQLTTSLVLMVNLVALGLAVVNCMAMKNVLKVFLALNIVREGTSAVINAVSAVVNHNGLRDVYVGRLILNAWWFIICNSYRRSVWVPVLFPPKQQFQQQFQS
jgi:hypothetical protein